MGRPPAQPWRRCVGCGRSAPKRELLRLVAVDGFAVPDPAGRRDGRGAYICRGGACLERAARRGGLARALRRPVKIAPSLLAGPPNAGTAEDDRIGNRKRLDSMG